MFVNETKLKGFCPCVYQSIKKNNNYNNNRIDRSNITAYSKIVNNLIFAIDISIAQTNK